VRAGGRQAHESRRHAGPDRERDLGARAHPQREPAAYCSSKGGLGLLTKCLALELAGDGIRVNAVAPGEIATPMTGNEDVDPQTVERPGIPLRRPGHAREMANVIAFLAGEESGYVTGSSFVADAG